MQIQSPFSLNLCFLSARYVVLLLLCGTIGDLASAATADEPFYLFRDGKPMATLALDETALTPPKHRLSDQYMIAMPDDVPSDVTRAVALFRSDLRAGYGINLPLGNDDTALSNRVEIVVEKRSLLEEDATTVDFPSSHVMRITGGESGVIRTLFYLLEEFGGARYLFQGNNDGIGIGAHFPDRSTLAIPRESFTHTSAFPMHRDSGQTDYMAGVPGERNRIYWWSWEARLGTKSRVAYSHNLTQVAFPIDQYMLRENKPDDDMFPILRGEQVRPWEWGADLKASYTARNYRGGWQPRYSSPVAVDEASTNLLAYLRENPGVRSLTLAVNDNGGHSQTEIDPAFSPERNPKLIAAYYGWVNAVIERVTAEFPDVFFGVIAYREVQPPPNFKLHPNAVVFLTFDVQACRDDEVRAAREKLIQDWSKLARIGIYSYDYGDQFYNLPRLYFREMQQTMQVLHEQGAVGAISERAYNTATEGPKEYLLFKLWENPDLDLEATLQDWCQAAVGADAAVPLREYYAFWEDFWRDKAIHTAWWNSRTATYLSLGKFGSYMFALEPGDIPHCRALMERVVALADAHGAEDQKQRARLLMAGFEWYEACATASGGAYFSPDGTLPDAATAAALLRTVPDAANAYTLARTLPHQTQGWVVPKATADWGMEKNPVPSLLATAAAWVSDPEVLAEFKILAEHPTLDPHFRFLASAVRRSAIGEGGADNLLPSGNFEQAQGAVGSDTYPDYTRRGLDGWETWSSIHGRVERSDAVAFHGTNSLKCMPAHKNFRALRLIPDAKPDTQYYFSAQVYVPADQPVQEGRLRIMGSPTVRQTNGMFLNKELTANIPDIVLTPGQWQYVACVIPGHRKTNSLRLRIDLLNFESRDVVFIDDVQVLEIGAK